MWPFTNKKPTMTLAEYATTRPPAPCGNQTEHVRWTEFEGMRCPACAAKAERERKERDENRMAEKIAAAVVRQMAERSNAALRGAEPASSAERPLEGTVMRKDEEC